MGGRTEQGLAELSRQLMKGQHFDCLAVGVLDFKHQSSAYFETSPDLVFDLASLTKPLVLGGAFLAMPELFMEEELQLLLNHQSSLPSGGRLSRQDWQQQINSYQIRRAPTLYSDYGALRLMLEIEKKKGSRLRPLTEDVWGGQGVCFWQDLKAKGPILNCPPTGERNGKIIRGEVHDDNAYVIGEFCSHAGLFSDILGLGKTLLQWNQKYSLLQLMEAKLRTDRINGPSNLSRFVAGWDTVTDTAKTLAGSGAGQFTFGHLGFTGTSIWIDSSRNLGHIILTNATKSYWYDRQGLNYLRKTIGEYVWKNFT